MAHPVDRVPNMPKPEGINLANDHPIATTPQPVEAELVSAIGHSNASVSSQDSLSFDVMKLMHGNLTCGHAASNHEPASQALPESCHDALNRFLA